MIAAIAVGFLIASNLILWVNFYDREAGTTPFFEAHPAIGVGVVAVCVLLATRFG